MGRWVSGIEARNLVCDRRESARQGQEVSMRRHSANAFQPQSLSMESDLLPRFVFDFGYRWSLVGLSQSEESRLQDLLSIQDERSLLKMGLPGQWKRSWKIVLDNRSEVL